MAQVTQSTDGKAAVNAEEADRDVDNIRTPPTLEFQINRVVGIKGWVETFQWFKKRGG